MENDILAKIQDKQDALDRAVRKTEDTEQMLERRIRKLEEEKKQNAVRATVLSRMREIYPEYAKLLGLIEESRKAKLDYVNRSDSQGIYDSAAVKAESREFKARMAGFDNETKNLTDQAEELSTQIMRLYYGKEKV